MQTSWLCTSAAEELNKGLPRTSPASGQGRTWTRDLQISSPAPWPLDRAALVWRDAIFSEKQKVKKRMLGNFQYQLP